MSDLERTIEGLPPPVGGAATLTHFLAAMKDGRSEKLTVGQVLAVFIDEALGGDEDFVATVAAALAAKLSKSGDDMGGRLGIAAGTTGSASMRLPDGVAPTSPVDGDIWRRDAGGGLFLRKGASTVGLVDTQRTVKSAKAHLTDTKAQGTNSQALANATWNIRQINTENSDPDGIVTISSNAFSLLAGSDYSVRAFAAALSENASNSRSILRFFNVTDGVAVQVVQPLVSAGATVVAGQSVEAILSGGKTYRVEQYTVGAVAGGINASNIAGASEVYLSLMIERLTNGFA